MERRKVLRQRTGLEETEASEEWAYATTIPCQSASNATVIRLGHARWLIENRAFNEMVTYWHADHVYRHHPTSIIAFWLTLMLVLNLFRAFLRLDIKPAPRARHTQLYFAQLLSLELDRGGQDRKPPSHPSLHILKPASSPAYMKGLVSLSLTARWPLSKAPNPGNRKLLG